MDDTAFRIFTKEQWDAFQAAGEFAGSALDMADGYIHLSAASQVAGTLEAHFTDADGGLDARLMIAEISLEMLGDHIRWEESRGGAAFPHVYDIALPIAAVTGICAAQDWPDIDLSAR